MLFRYALGERVSSRRLKDERFVFIVGYSKEIGTDDTWPRNRSAMWPAYRRAARRTAASALRLAARRVFRVPPRAGRGCRIHWRRSRRSLGYATTMGSRSMEQGKSPLPGS